MISRSRRFISQGSGLALAAAVAVPMTGHARHDIAMTPSLHSSIAAIASDRLAGAGDDQSARAVTDVAYNLELLHKWG